MRPAVLSAQMEMMLDITADTEELKAMPKADRPGEVSMTDVYAASQHCLEALHESGGTVADIQDCPLPSKYLASQTDGETS